MGRAKGAKDNWSRNAGQRKQWERPGVWTRARRKPGPRCSAGRTPASSAEEAATGHWQPSGCMAHPPLLRVRPGLLQDHLSSLIVTSPRTGVGSILQYTEVTPLSLSPPSLAPTILLPGSPSLHPTVPHPHRNSLPPFLEVWATPWGDPTSNSHSPQKLRLLLLSACGLPMHSPEHGNTASPLGHLVTATSLGLSAEPWTLHKYLVDERRHDCSFPPARPTDLIVGAALMSSGP